jgi:hypothetical protein
VRFRCSELRQLRDHAPRLSDSIGTNVFKTTFSRLAQIASVRGENVMRTLISIFTLTLAFAFTVPAFAGDTAAKQAEEQCQKDNGNWGAKSKTCSGKY